jgi:hypothetical protein
MALLSSSRSSKWREKISSWPKPIIDFFLKRAAYYVYADSLLMACNLATLSNAISFLQHIGTFSPIKNQRKIDNYLLVTMI